MTANTPLGLPYPEVTDRVADGWDAIRDLAEAADLLIAARATTASVNALSANLAAADAALDARLDTLEAGFNTDTGWQAAALATGWEHYSGFQTPAYRRIRGIVYLRGVVRATGFPEHAVHVFTLPAGYRPGGIQIFTGNGSLNTPDVSDVGVRVDITSAGLVQPTLQTTDTSGAVYYVSFSGINFPADA